MKNILYFEFIQTETMPHYKLTYFNTMGRAEAIRLLFAQAEIPYDDVRIEKEQWPDLKPSIVIFIICILKSIRHHFRNTIRSVTDS